MGPETEMKDYKIKLPIINTSITYMSYVLQFNDNHRFNDNQKYDTKIPPKWSDIDSIRFNDSDIEKIVTKWKDNIAGNKPNLYRIVKRSEEVIFTRTE